MSAELVACAVGVYAAIGYACAVANHFFKMAESDEYVEAFDYGAWLGQGSVAPIGSFALAVILWPFLLIGWLGKKIALSHLHKANVEHQKQLNLDRLDTLVDQVEFMEAEAARMDGSRAVQTVKATK